MIRQKAGGKDGSKKRKARDDDASTAVDKINSQDNSASEIARTDSKATSDRQSHRYAPYHYPGPGEKFVDGYPEKRQDDGIAASESTDRTYHNSVPYYYYPSPQRPLYQGRAPQPMSEHQMHPMRAMYDAKVEGVHQRPMQPQQYYNAHPYMQYYDPARYGRPHAQSAAAPSDVKSSQSIPDRHYGQYPNHYYGYPHNAYPHDRNMRPPPPGGPWNSHYGVPQYEVRPPLVRPPAHIPAPYAPGANYEPAPYSRPYSAEHSRQSLPPPVYEAPVVAIPSHPYGSVPTPVMAQKQLSVASTNSYASPVIHHAIIPPAIPQDAPQFPNQLPTMLHHYAASASADSRRNSPHRFEGGSNTASPVVLAQISPVRHPTKYLPGIHDAEINNHFDAARHSASIPIVPTPMEMPKRIPNYHDLMSHSRSCSPQMQHQHHTIADYEQQQPHHIELVKPVEIRNDVIHRPAGSEMTNDVIPVMRNEYPGRKYKLLPLETTASHSPDHRFPQQDGRNVYTAPIQSNMPFQYPPKVSKISNSGYPTLGPNSPRELLSPGEIERPSTAPVTKPYQAYYQQPPPPYPRPDGI